MQSNTSQGISGTSTETPPVRRLPLQKMNLVGHGADDSDEGKVDRVSHEQDRQEDRKHH